MASKKKNRKFRNYRSKKANHGRKPAQGQPRSQFKRAQR